MIGIILFLSSNISIFLMLGIILRVIGIQLKNSYIFLLSSIFFSISGSIISLFLSKKTALQSVNGKIIHIPSNNTEEWLFSVLNKQSNLVNIDVPALAIYSSKNMNAFATGFKKNNSLIAVSSGLLEKMSPEEIEAVIAHEITHIANGDMITMILMQNIFNLCIIYVSRILSKFFLIFFLKQKKKNCKNDINHNPLPFKQSILYYSIITALEFTIGIVSKCITMWFSRKREFYADAGSAKLVGAKKMIQALKKLQKNYSPTEPDSIITLCIYGKNNKLFSLLSSHPSLNSRILALKEKKYM